MNKIKYVAGFYFSEDKKEVALIRKNRPVEQVGKLNAIGGKIEIGECGYDAMVREFREETGAECKDWRMFCVLISEKFEVNFFTSFGDLNNLKSITDEHIEIHKINCIFDVEKVSSLDWLIPMALNKNNVFAVVREE